MGERPASSTSTYRPCSSTTRAYRPSSRSKSTRRSASNVPAGGSSSASSLQKYGCARVVAWENRFGGGAIRLAGGISDRSDKIVTAGRLILSMSQQAVVRKHGWQAGEHRPLGMGAIPVRYQQTSL